MGTINHNAVIATISDQTLAAEFQKWVDKTFPVGRVVSGEGVVNGDTTFILLPDGSKEGWGESGEGDAQREMFIKRIGLDAYEDGSSSWAWVEVGYGEFGQKVLRGNNKNCFNDKPYATDE